MTQLLSRADAALARREGVSQIVDRPSQRRSAFMIDGRPSMSVRAQMEIRESAGDSGDMAHFVGLATAYERGYEMYDMFGAYTEIVSAGAGGKSLAQDGLDVPLVLQHQQLRRIARTTTGTLILRETDDGLEVEAPNLDMKDQDVAYIVPKIRAGLIDEMSFAFRIEKGQWSPDYTEYRIETYDIHRGDVAIVGFGANPYTLSDLRSAGVPEKRARDLGPSEERKPMRLNP